MVSVVWTTSGAEQVYVIPLSLPSGCRARNTGGLPPELDPAQLEDLNYVSWGKYWGNYVLYIGHNLFYFNNLGRLFGCYRRNGGVAVLRSLFILDGSLRSFPWLPTNAPV